MLICNHTLIISDMLQLVTWGNKNAGYRKRKIEVESALLSHDYSNSII